MHEEYGDADEVNPGDVVMANIYFVSPQYHSANVTVGMAFQCCEGYKTIAEGEVIEVFPALSSVESKPLPALR